MNPQQPNQPSIPWKEISKIIATILGVYTILSYFLPTSIVSPIFALVLGFGITWYLVLRKKISLLTAVFSWLAGFAIVIIIFIYIIVSPPAIVTGVIIDQNGNPVPGLHLVFSDSSGVPHEYITDQNGGYEFKKIPGGEYKIYNETVLVSRGEIQTGLNLIFKPKIILPDLVYSPNQISFLTPTPMIEASTPTLSETPTSTATLSPSETPTSTVTLSPSETPISPATLSPSETPTSAETLLPSEKTLSTSTRLPPPPIDCSKVTDFKITSPDIGVSDHGTTEKINTKTPVPVLTSPTLLKWEPDYCLMDVKIFVGGSENHYFPKAQSGTITTQKMREGIKQKVVGSVWIEIKLWVPGAAGPSANLHIKLPE